MEVSNKSDTMSVTESEVQTTEQLTETTHRVNLRELGADLPTAAATCKVTIVGDVESTAEVRLELVDTTWIVDVALATGELEAVYDAHGMVPKPETVPEWLHAACNVVGVSEVTL